MPDALSDTFAAAAPRSLRDLIGADIRRYAEQSSGFQGHKPGLLRRISILLTPPLGCCMLARVSQALHRRGWRRIAAAACRLNALLHRVQIDPAGSIGPGLYIPHPPGVVFRGRAGSNLTLYTKALVGPAEPVPMAENSLAHCPVLGDDVLVGAFAIVVGPVSVGNGAALGPGSVVVASVEPGVTIAAIGAIGRPARD